MKQILIIFIILSNISYSQDLNSIQGRWSVKSSVAFVQSGKYKVVGSNNLGSTLAPYYTPSYRIEANYGFAKNMEFGLYVGSHKHLGTLGGMVEKEYSKQIGFSYNYHLLPLLFKDKSLPIDFYATARFGSVFLLKSKESRYYGFNAEYGIGVGVNYFFTKHIGFYADYLLGDFSYRESYFPENKEDAKLLNDFDKFRVGFVLKF